MRCDQSSATGFAPGELLLGRKLVYPVEFDTNDVDLTGTEFTTPLVLGLKQIHDENFSLAHKKIQKSQNRYKKKYDRHHKTKTFQFKVQQSPPPPPRTAGFQYQLGRRLRVLDGREAPGKFSLL